MPVASQQLPNQTDGSLAVLQTSWWSSSPGLAQCNGTMAVEVRGALGWLRNPMAWTNACSLRPTLLW